MTTRRPLRIGILLNADGSLGAAGVVRGNVAEGAKFLAALDEPIRELVRHARREAARLASMSRETPAAPAPINGA
jgi:hypothetical protein